MVPAEGDTSVPGEDVFGSAGTPLNIERPARSIFISDVHLGFRYSRDQALLDFLEALHPEYLYIVGDFLDGWRLRSRWHWPANYWRIVERILNFSREGTRVFYTPGNHDDFLRQDTPGIAGIEFADHFIHDAADGRRYYVVHGDLFDSVENQMKWLSQVGTKFYNSLVWSNHHLNRMRRRLGGKDWNYSYAIKRASKQMVGGFGRYERRLIDHARQEQCDGIICGHVHYPQLALKHGLIYCNTGDWVENASALIERCDGSLELYNRGQLLKVVPAAVEGQPPVIDDRRERPRRLILPLSNRKARRKAV